MFNFSNLILENIKYRKHFNENAFLQGKFIFEYYSNEVKNFDDIFNKAIPKCLECLTDSINDAVNILTEKGIYEYDSKFFSQRFGLLDVFTNDIEPVILKRSEIDEFASQLEFTKNIQRSSRSKWQGGGFGLKGAVKGAVTAGLLNAGTGILRGIGDSIADSVGDRKINSLKREAFENGNYDELLCDSIYKLNVLTGYYLCTVLAEHGEISKAVHIVDEEDLSRKINNIRLQASKSPSQIKNLVSQINSWISENPFSIKYYSCLYALLGKKDNSISQICSTLGYEKELEEYKKSVAESLVSNLKNSEENVEDKIKMIQHIKDTYELFEFESEQLESLEYNLKSQKKSEDEITAQLNENFYEETKADELITQGKLEEVWAMLNGENALIEYKLTQYYKNLVKVFIDRRDFAGIERKIPYVYEQYDNGDPYAIYLVSDIRREVYKRLGDNNKIIKTDEKILRLAKGGQISACAEVGFLCLNGYGYFKKDYQEAFKYLSAAAEKNQPMAMAWLGDMYLNGYGVEKDMRLAEKWLKISAYYGHPYAIKQLEKL